MKLLTRLVNICWPWSHKWGNWEWKYSSSTGDINERQCKRCKKTEECEFVYIGG